LNSYVNITRFMLFVISVGRYSANLEFLSIAISKSQRDDLSHLKSFVGVRGW
jgi:hypothetical protein